MLNSRVAPHASVLALVLVLAGGLALQETAEATQPLLWNKLGSEAEVTNSEIGPDGIIVGDIGYWPGQFDDGFQPEPRTGDHNIPDNFIRFNNLNLGQQGAIEFWYQPDWTSGGHIRHLFAYGKAGQIPLVYSHYNDWQNKLHFTVFDDTTGSDVLYRSIVPASTPEWTTTQPIHFALVWDGTAIDNNEKLKLFLNGNERGTLGSSGSPDFDGWPDDNYLFLASKINEGDWNRHNWEGSDGVIDNIKIWDYAKTDFSDRFSEGIRCEANELVKLLASDGAAGDNFGYGYSKGIDGDTVVIGALAADTYGSNSGAAYVFVFDGTNWVERAKLLPSDAAVNDLFGLGAAIDGTTIVIGAIGRNNYRGTAYVFERPTGGWTDMTETAKLDASDVLSVGDRFGTMVAIESNTIVVTAHRDDDNGPESGSAYVFVKPPGGWADMTETAKLLPSDGSPYAMFGHSVSMYSDTVVIGMPGENSNRGSAYVFVKPPAGWVNMTQTAKLTASDGKSCDAFGGGAGIALWGDTLLVGATETAQPVCGAGKVYVFQKPSGGWANMTESAVLTASDGEFGNAFGRSVALREDVAVVGADGDNDHGANSGSAYVFFKPEGGWANATESAKLTASDGGAEDHFGFLVAQSGDTVIVSADGDDDNGVNSGSVYVFRGLGDCNANGALDLCDVAEGTSADTNANGVPDECEAGLDIKPGSCPNSFNRSSHGVLPVSLLGTELFDVSQVNLSTLQLSRADGIGGSVAPHEGPPGPHTVVEDAATPFDGEACDCHEMTGDGIMDISMKFKTDELVPALGLDALSPGALVELTVSGNLLDGTTFSASDCVRLVTPGTGPGLLTTNSNLPQAWIDIAPLDLTLDGGGFGQFDRTWPQTTVVTFAAEEFYLGQRFVGWKFNGEFLSRDMTADVTVIDESQTVDAVFRRTGDITGDAIINLNDFAMFAVCFGQSWGNNVSGACSNEALASSDLDRDGIVNLVDFAIFATNFGTEY